MRTLADLLSESDEADAVTSADRDGRADPTVRGSRSRRAVAVATGKRTLEAAILTAAGAFVLRDIGEYADGVRSELGRGAATMRAELVHVGGTVLSGGLVAGGTIAISRWGVADVSVVEPTLATVTVAAGLFAVVLVAWALRGQSAPSRTPRRVPLQTTFSRPT